MATTISNIDKQIDAIHKQLCKLEKIDRMSAESWQSAWDRHPELRKAESALYLQRSALQQARNIRQAKTARKLESASSRAESKVAIRRSHIFQYLYDCSRAANLLGQTQLSQWYAEGVQAIRYGSAA